MKKTGRDSFKNAYMCEEKRQGGDGGLKVNKKKQTAGGRNGENISDLTSS